MVERLKSRPYTVNIGLVGKYIGLHDAYLSVTEALHHASIYHKTHVKIHWIDSEEITSETAEAKLSGLDGIIIPGGFGSRGIEGMIQAARYAREKHIPYFGICLGMQVALIEYARNVAGIEDANSGEFDEQCKHKVMRLYARSERPYRQGRLSDSAHIPALSSPEQQWNAATAQLL